MGIRLSDRLIQALDAAGVAYCHWKSNVELSRALEGALDLDLLVARESHPAALRVLADLGFRPAGARAGVREPGVSHLYALDAATGGLLHVHLFTRLLTGESLVKSHLLPFEAMLLDGQRRLHGVRVPTAEAELLLHLVRTFVKYGSLPDLARLVRKPGPLRDESLWLLGQADVDAAAALLPVHCPLVDEGLYREMVDALAGDAPLARRLGIARRLRRRLRPWRRRGPVRRLGSYAALYAGRLRARLVGPRRIKVPGCGGAVIAFVGPDATGKSTLVRETARWLGRVFAVRTVHAGKPPAGWLTRPLDLLLPVARAALPGQRRTRTEGRPGGEPGRASLLQALRAVALAWDRRRLLLRARREAASGVVVICDRYPGHAVGAMDSPRLDPARAKGLGRALARLEHRLYRQIPPPDAVVRLRVSLEVALRRNAERTKSDKHEGDHLEARHRALPDWTRADVRRVLEIDTDHPLEETVRRVREAVWQVL